MEIITLHQPAKTAALKAILKNLTPEQRTRYANLAALGRLGQPDDVAGVALFLASDLAKFVSGQMIAVDGGI